jgi:hypothetical protein
MTVGGCEEEAQGLLCRLSEEFFAALLGAVVRALLRKLMRFLEVIFSH